MKGPRSVGNYILISPMSNDESTYTGLVISRNSKGGVISDDVVLYHIDDVKIINYDGKKLHGILYYNIITKLGEASEYEKGLEFPGFNEF